MGKKIGIDLGTTYSVVSFVDDSGVVTNIESSEGEKTTPSVVYFDPSGVAVVGSRAREAGSMDTDNLVERVKNYMGDPNFKIEKNGQIYSAAAVSTLILRKLVGDAEQALAARGETIDGAIITCPAYFGDAAREATRVAGEHVTLSDGTPLKVLQILDEPTAAAVAYGNAQSGDMNKTVLIYDLGGGTFDCTVMKLEFNGSNKTYRVITTGGNHQLGGKDWDAILTDYVASEFCNATGADEGELKADPDMKAWFSENIEKAKQRLTSMPSVTLTVSYNGQKERIEVTLEKFNELTSGKFNETTALIDQMLKDKGMTMDEIDEIILVGGSTRMRQVEEGLKAYYNKPLVSFDPDKAVSNGAALVASGMNVDSNFGSDAAAAPGGAVPVAGDASLGGMQSNDFTSANGDDNHLIQTCTKSYCMRYYSGGEEKYVNLILKDTEKPARGSTKSLIPNLVLGGGDANGMTSQVGLYIMENTCLETDASNVQRDPLYEEMPIPFEPPVSASAPVEVELYVDLSGQLTLTLIEINTGVRHEVHPVRVGEGSNEVGMEAVAACTLG